MYPPLSSFNAQNAQQLVVAQQQINNIQQTPHIVPAKRKRASTAAPAAQQQQQHLQQLEQLTQQQQLQQQVVQVASAPGLAHRSYSAFNTQCPPPPAFSPSETTPQRPSSVGITTTTTPTPTPATTTTTHSTNHNGSANGNPAATASGSGSSSDAIHCICGYTDDDGWSIMCDECQRWSHMVCFDISVGKDPDEWRCWECHPRPVNVERARDRQARRVAAQARLGPFVGSTRAELLAAAQAAGGAGGTNQRRRRDRRTSLAVAPPAPPLSATQSGGGGDAAQEDEHVDIEDDWRTSYVHINEDIIPHAATRTKLGLAAQNWRGVTALSPDDSSEADSRTKVVPLPNGKDDVAAAVRPPSYTLQTTTPIANDALIAPFTSTVIPSAKYLADPLNAYAQMGLPKPHVHLVPPPLSVALDARMAGNETRFIRSGCRPNAVLRPVLCPSKQSGEDNDPGSVKFAVFAVRDLKASEEVVLGWEWDDGAVVHQLPALIEEGLRSGAGPSKMTPHHIERLRLQMQSIVESLKSSFVTCACGSAASDCAVKLMEAFAEGEFPWMNGFRGFRPSPREKSKSPSQNQTTATANSKSAQNNNNINVQTQASTSSQPHHQYHSPSPPQSLLHQQHQQHQNAAQQLQFKSPQPLPTPTPPNRHPTSFSALQDLSRYSNAKARARLLGPLVGKERGVRTRVVGGVESGGLEGVRQVQGDRWDRFGELDVQQEGRNEQAREGQGHGQVVPEVRVENATPSKRKVVDLKGKGKEKERVVMRGPNGVGLGLGLELPTGSVRTNSPLRSSFRGEYGEGDAVGQQVREVKEEQMPPKMRKRWIQQKMETLRSESAEAPPIGGSPRSDVAAAGGVEEATSTLGLGLADTRVDKDVMEVDEDVRKRGQELETLKLKDERSRSVSTPPPPPSLSSSRLRTNSMDVDLDTHQLPPPATSASAPAAPHTSPRPSLHSILTAPPTSASAITVPTLASISQLRAASQPHDQPQQSQARKASSLFSLLNDHPVSPIHSTNRYLAQVMNPVSMDPVPSASPTTVNAVSTQVEVEVKEREVTPEVKVDVEEEVVEVENVQPAEVVVESSEPVVDSRQPTPAPLLDEEPLAREEVEPEPEPEADSEPQPARSPTPVPAPTSVPIPESVPVVEETKPQEEGPHDEDEVKESKSRSLTPELSSALPSSPFTPVEPQRESEERQEPEAVAESARSPSSALSPPPASQLQDPAPSASPNLATERLPSIPKLEPEPAPPPATSGTTTNIRRSVEVTSPTVTVRRLSEALTRPRSFTRWPRSQSLLPRSESSGELSEVESEEEPEREEEAAQPPAAANEEGVVNDSRSRSTSLVDSAAAKEEVKEASPEPAPEPEPAAAPASLEREEVVEVVDNKDVDVDPMMLFKEELMQAAAEKEKKAQFGEGAKTSAAEPEEMVMVNDSPHVRTARSRSTSAPDVKEVQLQPDAEDVKDEMEVDVEVQVNAVEEVVDDVRPLAVVDGDVEMHDDASSGPLSPAPSPSPVPVSAEEEPMPAVEVQTPSSPASPASPVVKSPSLATDEALPASPRLERKENVWTELKPEPDSLEEKQAVLASLSSTLFPEAAPTPNPVPDQTTSAAVSAAISTSTNEARVSASPQLQLLRAPSPAVSVGSSSAQLRPTPPPFAGTSDNEHEHEHEHENGSDAHVQRSGISGERERSSTVSSAPPEPQKIRRSMADYKQRKKKQREEEAAAKAKSLELASPVTPVSPLPQQELQKVAESAVKVGHTAPESNKVRNGMDAERSGNVDLQMEASHSPAASTAVLSPQVPVQPLGEEALRHDMLPKREAIEDRVDLLPSPVTSSKGRRSEERSRPGLSSPQSSTRERPTTPQPEDGEIANAPAPPPTPPAKPRGDAKSSTSTEPSATAPTSTFSNPRTARLGSGGIAPPTQPRSFRDGRVLSASPPPRYNREPPPPPAPTGKSKIPPPWPSSRDRPMSTGAGTDSSSRTPTTPKEALPLDKKAESMSPVRRASSYVPGPPPPPPSSKSGPSTTSGPPHSGSATSPTIAAGGAPGSGGMRGPPPSGPRALRATSMGMSTRTQAAPTPRLPLAERMERDRGERERERDRDRDWEDRERVRDRVHDRERESERDRRERERDRGDRYSPPPLPPRGRVGRGRYWARGRR